MQPSVFLTKKISVVFKYNGSYIRQKNVLHGIYSVICLHTFLKHKLYSLKIMVNFLLVLVKTSYMENLKLFQNTCKIIFSTF